MRNKILSITRGSIPYIKELRPKCKSVLSCILMQQLDYWFEKSPEGYFKFKVPCNNTLYKVGDSWIEELGFSDDEFTMAFSKIGVAYSSKTAYANALNKFEDMFYLSYFDRQKGTTHYLRNHQLADEYLDSLTVSVNQESRFTVNPKTIKLQGSVNQESRFTENDKVGLQETYKVGVPYIQENTLQENTTEDTKHSSSSKISHEIFEGSFEEKKESLSPKNKEKKEGEKEGVSVKKTLSSKKAKEADPKTRPHLHIPFISTYQDFHASIKGSPIPNTLFSEHVAGLKKLRLLMIELSEKFKNGEASDDYVLLSFKAFLEKSWEVCKNDPKYSAAKFSPKFLAIDPLEILEKIKNNTKNGKPTTYTGERPNPGMQVRNAIIASERTDASVPILTAADFERMAKELA